MSEPAKCNCMDPRCVICFPTPDERARKAELAAAFETMLTNLRASMYRDDCSPVPSDIRQLIGEIDRLRDALRQSATVRALAIEEAAQEAQKASLPDGFQWGSEAMGSFEFGKRRAADAIRALSPSPQPAEG